MGKKYTGFSLVELMIAMSVFAITAASAVSAVMLARYTAEATMYRTTANGIAQSYLSQIKSLDFKSLRDASSGTKFDTIALDPTAIGIAESTAVAVSRPLIVGQTVSQDHLVDIKDPGFTDKKIVIPMRFTLEVEKLSRSGQRGKPVIGIKLTYEYEMRRHNGRYWQTETLRTLKTHTPNIR